MAAFLTQFNEPCALESAYQALSGDTRQLWHLLCDFDDGPEGLLLGDAILRPTPSFEVKLNGFAEVCARGLDVFALRSDVKLGAARHVPVILFCDEPGEAVGHTQMLPDASRGSKRGGRKE